MSLIYNATFDKNTRKLSFEDRAGNEIYSFIVPERGSGSVDDITKPLTFRATQDGSTVSLGRDGNPDGSFQTSRDGGNTWEDYHGIITLNTGDEVSFRAKANRTSVSNYSKYFYFVMKGKIEAWHNVMSMIRTNDFATYKTADDSSFYRLFAGCTSLVKAPALPATTLAQRCYIGMFNGCQSLAKAPELPATTLAQSCYAYMFYGCQSLKEVRVSATTTATDALKEWLSGVSSTGDFYCDPNATIFPTDSASGIPQNWRRLNINEEAPAVDDITKPLTFKATQDGSTVKLTKTGTPSGDFQTSTDGGNTWEDYTIGTAIALNTDEEVSFRAKENRAEAQNSDNYFYFEMTGKIEAWHNVMSLYRPNDFATYESVVSYAFNRLFMECTSLTKAPELPATTLATYCYNSMFYGCQSLTEAPVLPATTLASSCYQFMFSGCQSLTKAPVLPATTLADFCYQYMFSGCQSLNEVRIAATTTAYSALYDWLKGVSSTGDFYCNPNATIFPTGGADGIPRGWTRRNIADYPN